MLENLFVCIGAQKAGTKWLTSLLKTDKSFSMCPYVNEVHYFDLIHRGTPFLNRWRADVFLRLSRGRPRLASRCLASNLQNKVRELEGPALTDMPKDPEVEMLDRLLAPVSDHWYTSMLDPKKRGDWSADITPDYAIIGESGFRHMKCVAKNLKILFVLREPIERAWSGFLQGKKRFPGGLSAFAETGLDDIQEIVAACTVGKNVGARSDYEATLDALTAAEFSDEVLIKFYDEIVSDPKRFIDDVYEHLGKEAPLSDEKFHSALVNRVHVTEGKIALPEKIRTPLREFYAPRVLRLAKRLPVPASWLEQNSV